MQVYPNMRSAFVGLFKARGFRGLYAGLSPTLVEIVPYAGLQFVTYDTFKCWAMIWFCFCFVLCRPSCYCLQLQHVSFCQELTSIITVSSGQTNIVSSFMCNYLSSSSSCASMSAYAFLWTVNGVLVV